MADIILPDPVDGGSNWRPIGYHNSSEDYAYYTGTFDGNNKTISNMKISEESLDYVGMFGYIGSEGTVKDLGLIEAGISGTLDVGSIAGRNSGAIINCYSTGDVSGEGVFTYVGGIVGDNYGGSITASYNMGGISGSGQYTYAGGIAGDNSGIMTACYNTGDVTVVNTSEGSMLWGGGIAGINNGGSITASYNMGGISGSGQYTYAGGISGYNTNDGTITACYSTGNVSGTGESDVYLGGITGYHYNGTIIACYWSGTVTGENGVGDYNNSYNSEDPSGNATKVDENTPWTGTEGLLAMEIMNSKIPSEAGYEYVANDGEDSDKRPLLVVESQS